MSSNRCTEITYTQKTFLTQYNDYLSGHGSNLQVSELMTWTIWKVYVSVLSCSDAFTARKKALKNQPYYCTILTT